MLTTDAWAYLNIRHPLCAWATYRSTLCAPSEAGFVSVWTASILTGNQPAAISRELLIERYRQRLNPERVSRLTGMYCFLDRESADRAAGLWGTYNNHFRPEFLAELHLGNAGFKRDKLDSNWITYALLNEEGGFVEENWISSYWSGEQYPDKVPIWETLVDGPIVVLGTELRKRAYNQLRQSFPDSLMLLEIARLAAWLGSNLGNVCGYLHEDAEDFTLHYLMNMRDADDPAFLEKLKHLIESGHPVNWADMKPHVGQDSFGKTPDLRPFGFRRPRSQMPWLRTKVP